MKRTFFRLLGLLTAVVVLGLAGLLQAPQQQTTALRPRRQYEPSPVSPRPVNAALAPRTGTPSPAYPPPAPSGTLLFPLADIAAPVVVQDMAPSLTGDSVLVRSAPREAASAAPLGAPVSKSFARDDLVKEELPVEEPPEEELDRLLEQPLVAPFEVSVVDDPVEETGQETDEIAPVEAAEVTAPAPPVAGSPEPKSPEPKSPAPKSPEAAMPEAVAAEPEAIAPTVWPFPATLVDEANQLRHGAVDVDAAMQAMIYELEQLNQAQCLACPEARRALVELRKTAGQVNSLAAVVPVGPFRSGLLRLSYALTRRLEVWEQVQHVAQLGDARDPLSDSQQEALRGAIQQAESLLAGDSDNNSWNTFLEMEELLELSDGSLIGGADVSQRRADVAIKVLRRAHCLGMSQSQREYLGQPVLSQLIRELECWAVRRVDLSGLLHTVEQYELQPNEELAFRIADSRLCLGWSQRAAERELAARLHTHYRNANVRVAVTEQLLSRMLPVMSEVEEPIVDYILGAQVFGHSRTDTELHLALIPDSNRWRFGLEVKGQIASTTSSRKGPVTLYSRGVSPFRATTELTTDGLAIRHERTNTEAVADARLTGMRTEFDGIPIIGDFVRAYARQQHDSQLGEARWLMKGKMEASVNERLDNEVSKQLSEAETNFRQKLLEPLHQLGLDPEAVHMQTTEKRLVARCRLAGEHQLAAFTPRPQAPSDSLLSVQLHQSAVNNSVQQLKLAGRRADLRELYTEIASHLGRPDVEAPEDYPDDVVVAFADEQPVHLHWDHGEAILTVKIAELSQRRGARWRNFFVRAHYLPDTDGLHVRLVRDGYIELGGQRLRSRDQFALRGIFAKVFSKRRPIEIFGAQLADHPQMNDLTVNQFVIEKGWIGVAIGPQRKTQRWAKAGFHLSDSPR